MIFLSLSLITITNQVELEKETKFIISSQLFLGKIHLEKVRVARDGRVGEIIAQLERSYPGSFITLNNQLSHLQEDDSLEDVYEEGDVLTAVKLQQNICRHLASECRLAGDLVCLRNQDKQPILLEPGVHQCWELKTADFLSTMAVFR